MPTSTLFKMQICERLSSAANIDRESGVIKGVKILGRTSLNGRTYSDQALDDAARLYEGAKVNLDHPSKTDPHADRSIADRLGVLRNIERRSDGVYGDLHMLTSHPLAAMVMEAAEKFPDTLGLSQNAHGQVRKERGETIVETIEVVHSVDLVQDPATVAGLFESLENKEPAMAKKKLKKILESAKKAGCKTWYFKRLTEMVGDEEMQEMDEMEVELPAEQSAEQSVKAAFQAAVMAVFADDSLSAEETKARIVKLIDAAEEAKGGGEEVQEMEDDEEVTESRKTGKNFDPRVESLLEEVRDLKSERDDALLTEKCRLLLESKNREATDIRVKALKACGSDAERKELLETWSEKNAKPAVSRPAYQGLSESYEPTDGKSFADAIR